MASTAPSLRYALLFLASTLAAPAAWAHAHLTHQYPAADAEVTAAPQALTLNFSEGIKTRPAKRNEQDAKQLIIPLDQTLNPGTYTVNWHVVSVDGHKTKGQYTFSVK